MKSSLTNISVVQRPQPHAAAMAADGGTDTSNGKDPGAVPSTLNVTGTITYSGTSSVTVAGDVTVVGMIDSPFLKAFRETFMGSGDTAPWPRATVNTPAEVCTEFTDVFRALFLRREGSIDPSPGERGSAKQMIKELIEKTGWPDSDSIAVPEPWKDRVVAFRRYEIACTMDILMRAFHAKGAGGPDSPQLPPDR